MLWHLKRWATKLLGLKSFPCYVLSHDPPVVVSYWFDFLQVADEVLTALPKGRRSHLLFQLGWQRETDERMSELQNDLCRLQDAWPDVRFLFLCNSPVEKAQFDKRGLPGVFCHQNAFIDERKLRILPCAKKRFDAIYVARITPFKRHLLAAQVESLRLVGDHSSAERGYFRETLKALPQAVWSRKVRYRNLYKELSSARVGLCLSAEEGAMFVSAEYLLCGLPVVNTRNMGGRDVLFERDYALVVDDTPEAVAAGVKEMVSRKIDPGRVRGAALAKMRQHRGVFIKLVQDIYDQEGANRSFVDEWSEVFIHKLGLRRSVPWGVWRKRILKPGTFRS